MRKLALFATVVCLTSCLAVSAFGAPPPSGPTPVTVVNPPASPVPIDGTVKVSGETWVTAPASRPMPVIDAYTYVAAPVHIIPDPYPMPAGTPYTVPVGWVLVIEDVNVTITTNVPGAAPGLWITVTGTPSITRWYYPVGEPIVVVNVGWANYNIKASPRICVPPGAVVSVGWKWIANAAFTATVYAFDGAVSGRLVPAHYLPGAPQ